MSKTQDDNFVKAQNALINEKLKDTFWNEWPTWLRWMPCSKWRRYTWQGLSAMFCGAMLQTGIGVFNIWGALVIYFTSKYRGVNEELVLKTTLYTYPVTFMFITGAMQLGAWLLHKIDLRLQILLGVVIYCLSIFVAQFMPTFFTFVVVYSMLSGIGIGIIFFLPIACAWSYFPTIKPYVAGSILSWCSLSSIMWLYIARNTVNPNSDPPTVVINAGKEGIEKFFDPDSPQVRALPDMLSKFAIMAFIFMCFGIPFIRFNYASAAKKKNPAYQSVKPHLPFLTEEERNIKYRQRYGLLASRAHLTDEQKAIIEQAEREE